MSCLKKGFKIYTDGITNCKFDKDDVAQREKGYLGRISKGFVKPKSFCK